jgi:crossover junction endodeoxyribonuclease RuvC
MIILGVDPGTLITGFAVIEMEHNKYSVLAYDVIKNAGFRSMPVRLKQIYDKISKVIKQYHPDEFAIETAFYGKNAQSALKLGHARGVSILAAVNFQIPTAEYSPREIKKAVTGNGSASKHQVQFMVKSQLKLREAPKFLDASDALAIALCHSFRILNGKTILQNTRTHGIKSQRTWSEFIKAHPERVVRNK